MTEQSSEAIRETQPGLSLLSLGLAALGVLSILYRDFAYSWQPVPAFPGRGLVAIACGVFMVAVSMALHFRATAALAARALFVFLLAWLSLKIPSILAMPKMEAVWLGIGEVAMLVAGGWVVFARLSRLENVPFFSHMTGPSGFRLAQILFALAVLPVGLSHIFYPKPTAFLVPAWLPYRMGLGYLTGVAQMACGLAILLALWPRLAALIETAMLTLFAFLVWGPNTWFGPPKTPTAPHGARFPLTAFLITWVIAASALLVAGNTADGATAPLPLHPGRHTHADLAESTKA